MAGETKVDIWMPLYVSDFLTATLGWSAEERGHYLTLLMAQWAMGGLPNDLKALERISPGVGECWGMLGEKFAEGDDGKLRNGRLEDHRSKSLELREQRSKRASKASKKRWRSDGRCSEQSPTQCSEHSAKECPSYAASSSSSPSQEKTERQYARAGGEPPLAEPKAAEPEPLPPIPSRAGWVHDEWARIVAAWNATERAVPWTLLSPPNGFADLAASPGWVESALAAVALLPQCRRFERPVPWTQFVREIDRILAGEFRDPREDRRELAAAGGGAGGRQQRRGNMR